MGEAKNKHRFSKARFEDLGSIFCKAGIRIDAPGFYDDPAFLIQERQDPQFLEFYAEWVKLRPTTPDYEIHTRTIVPKLTKAVLEYVIKHEIRGACVDASLILSRTLDRLGIWNYIVAAGFNVELLDYPELGKRYFWVVDQLDSGAGQLGHVYVVAPPFNVVDPTIGTQGWVGPFKDVIPECLVMENCRRATMTVKDMVATEILQHHLSKEGSIPDDLHFRCRPDLRKIETIFPGVFVETPDIRTRYLPAAIRAPDVPLEDIGKLTGLDGARFWNEIGDPLLTSMT